MYQNYQKIVDLFHSLSLTHINSMYTGVTIVFFAVYFLVGPQIGFAGEKMAYFTDPKQAVDSIKTMLLSGNWVKLASYYDLKDMDAIERETFTSGNYFIRKESPELIHPGGFWRYKHPFSPQYDYFSYTTISDEFVEVTVYIEIDEGFGMVQRGIQVFYLRKSVKGYQLLSEPPQLPAIKNPADSQAALIQPYFQDMESESEE